MREEFEDQTNEDEDVEAAEAGDFWALVPLPLTTGGETYVEERFRPALGEWDWARGVDGAIERAGNKGPVSLYDEQLWWHFRQRGADPILAPLLDRQGLRVVFGGNPAYLALLDLAARQRVYATQTLGATLPPVTLTLAETLAVALLDYHLWTTLPNVWRFTSDPEGLTPGTLALDAKPPTLRYATLGAWMDEYTGDWHRSTRAETGLVASTYARTALQQARDNWRAGLDAVAEEEEDDPYEIVASLRDGPVPPAQLYRAIRDTIRSYPIPQMK